MKSRGGFETRPYNRIQKQGCLRPTLIDKRLYIMYVHLRSRRM